MTCTILGPWTSLHLVGVVSPGLCIAFGNWILDERKLARPELEEKPYSPSIGVIFIKIAVSSLKVVCQELH